MLAAVTGVMVWVPTQITYAAIAPADRPTAPASPSSSSNNATSPQTGGSSVATHSCGAVSQRVDTAIDIGCRGQGNPILDMMFAVIRLLSNGVGLVIIGSIIYGGIQYTTSAGDPQKSAMATGRIRQTLIALGIYIFSYPLLNYLIPRGFFHG